MAHTEVPKEGRRGSTASPRWGRVAVSRQAFPGPPKLTAEAPARGAGPVGSLDLDRGGAEGDYGAVRSPTVGETDSQALQKEGWVRLGRVLC